MSIVELLLLALGLAMDAFAVAVCKGMAKRKFKVLDGIVVGLWFGAFQAVMPLIGYFAASLFSEFIQKFDHWVAFILLAFIGGKMIYEGCRKEQTCPNGSLSPRYMIVLALATSIDALAVGVTFAFLSVNVYAAVGIIGGVTLLLSFLGVMIGAFFGSKLKNKAEISGGVILILMGVKILVEHLFF